MDPVEQAEFTDDDATMLDELSEKALKQNGQRRANADPLDIARIHELRAKKSRAAAGEPEPEPLPEPLATGTPEVEADDSQRPPETAEDAMKAMDTPKPETGKPGKKGLLKPPPGMRFEILNVNGRKTAVLTKIPKK